MGKAFSRVPERRTFMRACPEDCVTVGCARATLKRAAIRGLADAVRLRNMRSPHQSIQFSLDEWLDFLYQVKAGKYDFLHYANCST